MKRLLLAAAFAAHSLIALAADPQVELKTSAGTITLELYPDKAPKTVANFLDYVKSGFYDGLVFHRVIPGFMIQGGGMNAKMEEKAARPPIPAESKNGLHNETGSIAMARTSDPNSASSQFFINVNNNSNLDYPSFDGTGYTVFGKVTAGMDAVAKIAQTPTATRGYHQNVPVQPIVIESARLVPAK
jgi:peptidyl-prolyl cis-trans isomerase A (cyclophilin A)